MKNTGMAVSLDVGEPKNIHPADKQTVGARLADAALGGTYGDKVESSSPTFVQATVENGSVRAWFSHADGLTTKGQPVGGFEVAGYDRKFVPAEARIEKVGPDETIVASASAVPHPRYVRYGWAPVVTRLSVQPGGFADRYFYFRTVVSTSDRSFRVTPEVYLAELSIQRITAINTHRLPVLL